MQITSTTTIPFVPVPMGTSATVTTTSSSSTSSPDSDQAVLNMSASTFSSLVQEAKAYPEVRSDVVQAYKAGIASGSYPSEEVVAGLIKLMGGLVK